MICYYSIYTVYIGNRYGWGISFHIPSKVVYSIFKITMPLYTYSNIIIQYHNNLQQKTAIIFFLEIQLFLQK